MRTLLNASVLGVCLAAAPTALAQQPASGSTAAAPVVFEKTRGSATGGALFVAHGKGYALALSADEARLAIGRDTGSKILGIRLAGAARAEPEGLNALPARIYYLPDGEHPTPARTFARVRYGSVYPGIDAVYHGDDRRLEFDFVVAPHADPARIALDFAGADRTAIGDDGDLILMAGGEEVRLKKPMVYQQVDGRRRDVDARFALRDDSRVGFAIGNYDSSLPLVIDPVIVYASYLGSAANETVVSVQTDSAGNMYVFGRTFDGATFPTTNTIGNNFVGSPKCFVSKFDPSGASLLYSAIFADSFVVNNDALCDAMKVTADGRVAVLYTGNTLGSFVKTVRVLQDQGGVLTSPLSFRAVHLEGLLPAHGIDLDASNHVYALGACFNRRIQTPAPVFRGGFRTQPLQSSNCKSPDNAFSVGPSETVLAKYDASGGTLYATYIGGSSDDEAAGLALEADDTGHAYVAGRTRSDDLPVSAAAFQAACNLANGVCDDAFFMKIDTTQSNQTPGEDSLAYSSFLGGSLPDRADAIHVGPNQTIFVGGSTEGVDFPSAQSASAGAFVSRFDIARPTSAQLVATTLFPYAQSLFSHPGQFAFLDDGAFAISGATLDPTFPLLNDLGIAATPGIDAPFVSVFAPDGTLSLSTLVAPAASGMPRIAAHQSNEIYVGMDSGLAGLATPGSYQQTISGGVDVLLMRIRGINGGPNQPPAIQTNTLIVYAATSPLGASVPLFALAVDPDGDPVSLTWQYGAQAAVGPSAVFQFPIGISQATVTGDDGHGHQVQVPVTVVVNGAVVPSGGNASVHPPASYDTANVKASAFLPDVRVDLLNVTSPGIVTLNIRTDMLPKPPASRQFGSPPYIYDVATTATASQFALCIDTAGMTFADAATTTLYASTGTAWTALTMTNSGTALCATVTLPGSFAIFTATAPGSAARTLAGTGRFADFVTNPDGSTVVVDGGQADQTPLLAAQGAAIDRVRNVLYVSDFNRIRRVDLTTGIITTVAGNGAWPDTIFDLATGFFRLVDPDDRRIGNAFRLALDGNGKLYIAEASRCRVLRLDPDTLALTRFAGDGVCRSAGDGLLADQASIIAPFAIAFDAAGDLFIADAGARVVRRVDAATGRISTVVGDGSSVLRSGVAGRATGITPVGLAVGKNGDLYIVQDDPFLVRVQTGADGVVNGGNDEIVSVVNSCALSSCPALPFDGDGHSVSTATFHGLFAIASEPSGALLVGEGARNRVRRIAADSNGIPNGSISTVAGFDATTNDPPTGSHFYQNGEEFALSSALARIADVVPDPAGGLVWVDSTLPQARHTGGDTAPPPAQADVAVVVSSNGSVAVGQGVVYTVTVTNNGPAAASSATLTMPTPANGTIVGAGSPAGTTCSIQPSQLRCDIATLAAGQQMVFTITARATAAGQLSATFTVAANESDPQPANNTAASTLDVDPAADLAVVVAAPANGATVDMGVGFNIDVAVSNAGPNDATPMRLRLPLPSGLAFVAATIPAGSCDGSFGIVLCDINALAAHASVHATITLRPTTTGTVAATFGVSSPVFDPTTANNQAILSVNVVSTPAMINVLETIVVTDTVGLLRSAMLGVAETITVDDAPSILPSAMLGVVENVVVSDAVAVVASRPADTVPPVLTVPANMTVAATDAGGATVVFTASAVDDRDGAVTPTCAPASGSKFPIGTTTVTCTAVDSAGNQARRGFTVAVVVGAPQITARIVGTGSLIGTRRFVDIELTNTGTGHARQVDINLLLALPTRGFGAIRVITPLPIHAGDLYIGARVVVRVVLDVPSTARQLLLSEIGTLQNVRGAGTIFVQTQRFTP